MKKIVLLSLLFSTTTQMHALRYGKKTGTKLITAAQELHDSVKDTFTPSFTIMKKLENKYTSSYDKTNAEKELLKKARTTKINFSFFSNLLWYKENESLNDHPLVIFVNSIDSYVTKIKKYSKRLERLKKDLNKEINNKKISTIDKDIYEKILTEGETLLKKIIEQKNLLKNLEAEIRSTKEYHSEKKSYHSALNKIELNRSMQTLAFNSGRKTVKSTHTTVIINK